MKSRPKGRHSTTKAGKPRRSKKSNQARAAQKEPWLLAVSPNLRTMSPAQVVRIYAGRMQIEQTFRDLKSTQWGMGMRTSQTRSAIRLAALLMIGALVAYALWLIGLALRHAGHDISYGRTKSHPTLSILSLASYWLARAEPLPISTRQLNDSLSELVSMVLLYEL